MFKDQGLDKRLGRFVGSPRQNMALLEQLQSGPKFYEGDTSPILNAKAAARAAESEQLKQFSIENSPRQNQEPTTTVFDNPVMQPFVEAATATQTSTPNQISGGPIDNYLEGFRQRYNIAKADFDRERGVGLSMPTPEQTPTETTPTTNPVEVASRFGFSTEPTQVAETLPGQTMEEAFGTQATTPAAPATNAAVSPTVGTPSFEDIATQTRAIVDRAREMGVEITPTMQRNLEQIDPQSAARDVQVASELGTSGSQITPSGTPGAEVDLINDWLSTAEGKLALEKYEKENLDAQSKQEQLYEEAQANYATEKATVEQNLAEAGLTFSGIKASQIKSLADNLAASELGADREFASKLINADINFRETILKGVADLIKEAQNDNKDAIQQLNKMGYAVYDGMILPTLSRENAQIDDIRADAQLQLSIRRLELAEAANSRAAFRLQRDLDKEGQEANDITRLLEVLSSDEAQGVPDNEIITLALESTDLSLSDIRAVMDMRTPPVESVTQEAAQLVANYAIDLDEESWTRDRTTPSVLAEARIKAVEALTGEEDGGVARINPLTGEEFVSDAHRTLLIDLVTTVDSDLINEVEFE